MAIYNRNPKWKAGQAGGTPITAAALENIEDGIEASSRLVQRVDHGTDPNVARPAGAVLVIWRGSVAPVNAVDTDQWVTP